MRIARFEHAAVCRRVLDSCPMGSHDWEPEPCTVKEAMNKVISADSHVQEPPELDERIPKALRHRAPRIVERDGARYLVVDGRPTEEMTHR